VLDCLENKKECIKENGKSRRKNVRENKKGERKTGKSVEENTGRGKVALNEKYESILL
jgi:hypothetical protein